MKDVREIAKQPFAVFDIDGTLIRWQLYHALADELARRGLLDGAGYQQVREARMKWKNRSSERSYQEYEEAIVRLINASITEISPREFKLASEQVISVYKGQAYTFTRNLIAQLRADNYLLFAISASQIEIVSLLADYYGFDDWGGSRYEVKNGRFTGEVQVLLRGKKPELLRQLVAKHQAGWENSLGIGDSESDIPMLNLVEQPLAFNPTKELFEHAQAHRWKIILERKSVVYELGPVHGSYILIDKHA